MKDLVNKRIKFGEEFRPFCAVHMSDYYSDYSVWSHPSLFMTHVFEAKSENGTALPAVTDVDGTARVQIVNVLCLAK
jgi:carbamoyltransferase